MTRAAVVLVLVVLVLLLALPLGLGVAMSGCPECHVAGNTNMASACASIASVVALLLAIGTTTIRRTNERPAAPPLTRRLDRPPRAALGSH
jgi:hypothetical protein